MIPIELNKYQINSLNDDSTMLWFPIYEDIYQHENTITFDKGTQCWFSSLYIESYSPLQIGQEYIAQTAKEFECAWCKGKDPQCTDCYGTGKVWDIDIEIEFIPTDIQVKRVQDLEAVEIKDLGVKPIMDYNDRCPETGMPCSDYYSAYKLWYNKQYPEQPYETNPYGFLVAIERILNE